MFGRTQQGTPIGNFWSRVGSVMSARAREHASGLNPYDWRKVARPNQLPPGSPGAADPRADWTYWVVQAGRGFGKTRIGAETIREWVKEHEYCNLIGATADDARDIMIEGESGILARCPPNERPTYRPSKRRLEWPNGAKSLIFTADEPDRLRGKQHMKLWADEVAAWRYAEAWDQAMFGLRLGKNPQAVVTTTPKPVKFLIDLVKDPDSVVTRGSTYENRANLAPKFFEKIIRRFEGTRLGRQELDGVLLEDVQGALWKMEWISAGRVQDPQRLKIDFQRVAVAVDPAVTNNEGSSETGIVCAVLGDNGEIYVLDDWSCSLTPAGWGARSVELYDKRDADILVGEVNNGGDLVETVIRAVRSTINFKQVRASRGKHIRAEPVAALYEQGKVHHVGNDFQELEHQMVHMTNHGYQGEEVSPDRLDALVWVITELLLQDTSDELPPAAAW